jgi:hypothetical protein
MTSPASAPARRSRVLFTLAFALGAALFVYALMVVDVTLRAREAYSTAERYLRWNQHPDEKVAYYDRVLKAEQAKLENRRAVLSETEYRRQREVLEFDRQFNIDESSLKYAYHWYKDTYELFSPPESRWVKLARQKAPQTLELWKNELREKKIPFNDLEIE